MTPRVLKTLSTLGIISALVGAAPVPVEAQTCGLTITLREIDGEEISTTNQRPVSAAECAAGATVTYRINTLPARNSLEVFRGTGNNCADGTVRTNQQTVTCYFLSTTNIVPGQQYQDFDVPLTDDVCTGDEGVESKIDLWFLATDTSQSATTINECAKVQLSVDARPPVAPTGLNAPRGESTLDLSWSPPTDTGVNRYIVFIDQNPDENCGSSVMAAGDILDLDNLPDGVVVRTVQGATARSATIPGSSIPNGDAAVAVAAQDLAGNVGLLSELTCAKIVPTEGFWDVYKAGGGAAGGSGDCSTLGGAGALGAAGLFSPALLTLFGLRLRSRRRNS